MNFYQRMGLVCQRIPEGKVATYGQIALLCQKPGNARQVGYGLRMELAGQVPAHRIVNGKGILSGAAAFEVPGMQKMLLEEEGVPVVYTAGIYQVDLKVYGWKHTLEEAETLAQEFVEKEI